MFDFNYIFKNKIANVTCLQEFGFKKQKGNYVYKTKIVDNQFLLTVYINKNNLVEIILKDTKYNKCFNSLSQIIDVYLQNNIKSECLYNLSLISELCFIEIYEKENNTNCNLKNNLINFAKDYNYLCNLSKLQQKNIATLIK